MQKENKASLCLVQINEGLRMKFAEILRPLTSARNYANLSLPKKQIQEVQ